MNEKQKEALAELEAKLIAGDNMMGVLRKAGPEVRGYYRKWLTECKQLLAKVKGVSNEQGS